MMIDGNAMAVDKDVAIPMSDGATLYANVFRPSGDNRWPVLMAQGVYGKDLHFEDGYRPQYEQLARRYPGLASDGSTGRWLRWETLDPERWTAFGYVVIQVDARGIGKSGGYLDPRCPREITDFYEAIEWAAAQPWSTGKVGLAGVSYYAVTQWAVAALRPPSLAAIAPWEGFADSYRDTNYHGGIFSNAQAGAWFVRQINTVQHGAPSPHRDRETGERFTGTLLSDEILCKNRVDNLAEIGRHRLDDAWHRERSPRLARIEIPVLSAGNWGGAGMHLRGNLEGYLGVGSREKWLSLHIGTHWESFYLPEYVALQRRFFDWFLKGEGDWPQQPPVRIAVRQADGSAPIRFEQEFPLARTRYIAFHLDATTGMLGNDPPAITGNAKYDVTGDGVTFFTAPFAEPTEITGFITAHLIVASAGTEIDLFVVLRAIGPDGVEVVFAGAHGPAPLSRGWLRASHRKLDAERTTPFRVVHAHDQVQSLIAGEPVALSIEILPTCVALPAGSSIALTLMGRDYTVPGSTNFMLHDDPDDRKAALDAGEVTILTGPGHDSRLVLPIIPPQA